MPKNVASKRASQKKKQDGAKRGRGFAKKNSFKFWGDGICIMQTPYQNAKINVSDFQNIQIFQGKYAPRPST